MAGNRVETTIAYRLDARGLRDAKSALERSFKPESVKALNTALKDAQAKLKALSAEYGRTAKAQGAMANAPKALRDGIKAARAEVQRLTTDLGKQLEAQKKLLELEKQSAQLAKQTAADNRRAAFRQGLGGGLLASVLTMRDDATSQEKKDELRAQFAGRVVGGGLRRVGGAIRSGVGMASSMTGGAGPMGTMLGGIPFLGGAAQLAEGAVSSFVERQRAQLGAMPYVGASRTRQVDVFGDVPVASAAAAQAARTGVAPWQTQARGNNVPGEPGAGAAWQRRAAGNAATGGSSRQIEQGGEPLPWGDIAKAVAMGPVLSLATGAVGDIAGQIAADSAAEAIAAAPKTRREKIGTKTVVDSPFDDMRAAVHGLMTGTEAIQAGTAFTKQTGGLFNKGQFAQGFAAETLHGVDQGTSAQLFRAQRAGRGGTSKNQQDMLAQAIGSATAQGLEGSDIGEYLDTIAQAQAQASSKGLTISTEGLADMAVALSRGGLAGPQAGRVAGGIQSFAESQLTGGLKGPLGMALMQSQGFDPTKGNFLETRAKLAGGMDAGGLFDFLQQIAPGGGSEAQRGFNMETALRSGGIDTGVMGGIKLANLVSGGKEAFMASVGGQKGSAQELLESMLMERGGRQTALGAATGAIRGQNAVADTLVGAGGAAAGNVLALQQQAAHLAGTIATSLKVPLDSVSKSVVTMSQGIEGILGFIKEWFATGQSR